MNAQQQRLLARKITRSLKAARSPKAARALKQYGRPNPALARVVRSLSPAEIAEYGHISESRAARMKRDFLRFVQKQGSGYRKWQQAWLEFLDVQREAPGSF